MSEYDWYSQSVAQKNKINIFGKTNNSKMVFKEIVRFVPPHSLKK